MKIAHICPDEKFIDFIAQAFDEISPGSGDFYIFSDSSKLKYVKKTEPVKILPFSGGRSELIRTAQALGDYQLVIIHYLSERAALVVRHIPDGVPLLWSGWGADYHKALQTPDEALYLPFTAATVQKIESQKSALRKIVRRIRQLFMQGVYYGYTPKELTQKIVPKFQYFSAPVYEDYLYVKERMPEFKADYLPLNYAWVDENDPSIQVLQQGITGENILLGNSASFTNNHEDAMELLSRLDLTGRKVITPLSYGSPAVRKSVLEAGRRLLGENFQPLLEFMELEEYNRLIGGASVVVMNHRRQQGLGNIITMMYRGVKIFLHPDNTIYEMLHKAGAHVHSVESLRDKEALEPLSAAQIKKNRSVIMTFWGRQAVLENIRKITETIGNQNER